MSSWDFMSKSGIYVTDNKRLYLFCFYVYKIDFYTEIFALDLSSLLIVRANNLAIFIMCLKGRKLIWFVRYLLQLPIKIAMLALAVKLFCYFLGKTAVKDPFYWKFKFIFSFLFISLLELEWIIRWQQSVVSMVPWYRINRSYWFENLQLSFCLSILKEHMNLNGIQRLYGLWEENAWIINSRSSQTFNLVYTDIS